MQTSVRFNVNGEEFGCEGKTMKYPGFTSVMYWLAIQPEESLPRLQVGECEINGVSILPKIGLASVKY